MTVVVRLLALQTSPYGVMDRFHASHMVFYKLALPQLKYNNQIPTQIHMSYNYLFKCIIIGDTNVGKSCLLLKYIDNTFRLKHEITIGVEFGSKLLNVSNRSIKLQVWDTAGQQSFKSITRGYYRSAAAALVVYDITDEKSFRNVEKWLQQLKLQSTPNIEVILVGNKCDLEKDRKVSWEQGAALAKSKNMHFVEVSAKTSEKVDDAFKKICEKLLQKIDNGIIKVDKETPGIKTASKSDIAYLIPLSSNDKKKKTTCC